MSLGSYEDKHSQGAASRGLLPHPHPSVILLRRMWEQATSPYLCPPSVEDVRPSAAGSKAEEVWIKALTNSPLLPPQVSEAAGGVRLFWARPAVPAVSPQTANASEAERPALFLSPPSKPCEHCRQSTPLRNICTETRNPVTLLITQTRVAFPSFSRYEITALILRIDVLYL